LGAKAMAVKSRRRRVLHRRRAGLAMVERHQRPDRGQARAAFRALVKAALRHYGLRAIEARELDERAFVFPSHPPRSTRETPMSAFSERIRSQTKGLYKVADLEGGKEVTHTVSHLDEEMEMFGKVLDILNFTDTGKQLSVNQTNAEFLLDKFGDDPEKWAGQSVTLYLGEYEYNKEKKRGIRLKLPGTKSAAKEGVVIPPAHGDGASKTPARSASPKRDRKTDLDDEIPF
jgi:hypothetical protein